MAKIVLAMATTHGPQLHTTVEQWQLRVKADKERKHPFRNGVYSFDELVAMRQAEGLDAKSSMDAQRSYHARCHAAMEKLADKWDEVGADVAVILGNDQDEIYETDQLNPAFMVFFGDTIPSYPQSEEDKKKLPPGIAEAEHGHADRYLHRIQRRARSRLAHHQDADGARIRRRGLQGLAEACPQRRLARLRPHLPAGHARQGRAERADLPEHVLPAQPADGRSGRTGSARSSRRRSTPGIPSKRVAVFASGGMSHFVIDEDFDRRFVAALKTTRQELSHLDSAEGAAVRHIGAEVLDFARRVCCEDTNADDARDRLRAVLSLARRHRHGQRLLLVGHQALTNGCPR